VFFFQCLRTFGGYFTHAAWTDILVPFLEGRVHYVFLQQRYNPSQDFHSKYIAI